MVSLVAWYAGLAVVQAALAFWVIFAQPRRVLNWAVGTLLLLWAGSGVLFQLAREATDPAEFLLYRRVASYYEAPAFLLILLVIDRLLLRPPRSVAWKATLAVASVALLAFWGNVAAGPFLEMRHPPGEGIQWVAWRGALVPSLNATANILAQCAAVVVAARVATDARRGPLQRRQAALVGLAFALLIGQPGGGTAGYVATGRMEWTSLEPTLWAGFACLAASLYALPRIPRPFHGGARAAVAGSVLLVLGLGFVDSVPGGGFSRFGVRVVVLSAFALVLAVAILRYDLADRGMEGRRRVQAAAAILLGLCVAAIVAGAAWSIRGPAPVTLGVALLAMLAPLSLLATPLKGLPEWLTRRVLLHPRDPDALRERVRVYAGTLRAATTPEGRVPPGMEATLAALRAQLGLSRRDHDLLLAMAPDPDGGRLVAYRLALKGAAGTSPDADGAELRALRDVLGVSERDHALVLGDLQRAATAFVEGTLFLGRYRVARRLGAGGFGDVWLAHDGRLGRNVVLKRLLADERRDARALQRVQREVRAAGALHHPHVVALHDVETVGDETFLVMEYLPGGSLADAVRARGRMPEEEVLRMGLDVLQALGALHARGIVHRDVKPANVLLDARGRAKLGDFTIARELVSGDTVGPEGTRGPVGTFAYMPPEQARGLAARPQADLYALAATMREALAGAPLRRVEGLSHREAVSRIAREAPPPPVPHASPRVNAALARALSKAPEDRFPDAASMAAALADPAASTAGASNAAARAGPAGMAPPAGAPTPAGTPGGSGPRPPRPPA